MKKMLVTILIGFLCLSIFSMVSPETYAPVTNYSDDFSVDTGIWNYTGTAYRDSAREYVVLTEAVNARAGSAWFEYSVNSSFALDFRYWVGNSTGTTTDGFVVMFYKQRNDTLPKGGYFGFCGPGYGVEFDTAWNDWDPSLDDHVALIEDSVSNHLAYVNDARLSDNTWHNVSVTVTASSVAVYIDAGKILEWNGTLDRAYDGFGFSAGTGEASPGDWNEWHIIDDFSIMLYAIRDIAVVDIHSMKKDCSPRPTVCRNMTTKVYAAVENRGTELETFDLTLYAQPHVEMNTTGLVGYWKFDEGLGNIAYDSSSCRNNGTIGEAEWVSGISGSALRFSDTKTHVNMSRFPDGLGGNTEFTVSFWIRVVTWPSPSQQYSYLVFFGSPSSDRLFHILLCNDPEFCPNGTVRPGFWGRVRAYTNHTFSTGVWYHWAFVYDKTKVRMYQNGTFLEDVTLDGAAPNLDPLGPLVFSTYYPVEYFDGILDEVAIYSRALSADEIYKAYANVPTAVQTKPVSLSGSDSTVVTFEWNTTGLDEYQNYTLIVRAAEVLNETNVVDNTMSDGIVLVTHMGDITGDGKVDIADVSRVSGAYGSLRVSDFSDPQYGKYCHPVPCVTCPHEPNADITGDSKVDIQDLARTSGNFGWHR